MFHSFFPKPKLFFGSAVLWTAVAMAAWYLFADDWGRTLSIGGLFGFGFPVPLPEGADEATVAAFNTAERIAIDIWVYQYMLICGAIFCAFWARAAPHKWFRWSVIGSAVIIFVTWFQVQVDVMINEWFGRFYDMVQQALDEAGSVQPSAFYVEIATFAGIAMVAITVAVVTHFLASHYVFRWRTAMNDYYVDHWQRLRHIEGAAQRVQEDTMRFAAIVESLGVRFIDSVMTLIAFLPILWGLSSFVKVLPIVGEVPQALVFVAIIWSAFGTALLALAGIRLPGLEFRNQRVEAAYRKELVFGEDHAGRAQPPELSDLFSNVRRNYFRIYLNYLYFNVARYAYLQAGVLVPYVALAPTILTAGFTLGVMQQIIRAFGRVESSFQFLVNSWTTIVELISIYKRLKAFEATLDDEPLSDIEREVVPAE
ncbi:peptide antibiotic transporter SbmA [Bauldia sp.]|uniref:peptide antibiotic transporter SbmA n=1 Tax=Bauldia sp. TaxID=2575872 RepID=UPI003BA97FCF